MSPPIDPEMVILRIRELVTMRGGPKTVSEACDIAQPTLETYLRGKSLPGALALASLSTGMRVSADWLLFGKSSGDRKASGEVHQ